MCVCTQYRDGIRQVAPQGVLEAAQRHLHPEEQVCVTHTHTHTYTHTPSQTHTRARVQTDTQTRARAHTDTALGYTNTPGKHSLSMDQVSCVVCHVSCVVCRMSCVMCRHAQITVVVGDAAQIGPQLEAAGLKPIPLSVDDI